MDGILIIDKPGGMTSHDVVDFIRRRFNIKKAGHAGTLDPSVTGVLVVLVGKATKLSAELTSGDKEYEATMVLGKRTDSGDADGKTIATGNYSGLTQEKIREVFKTFEGEIEQVPPMVSALRHKGKRLYELARQGKEVERAPRTIHIRRLTIERISIPEIDFSVACSKGTYIRKLCDDIGEVLGCGGYLSYLRRIRAGGFGLDQAVTIDKLKGLSRRDFKGCLIKT